MEELSLETLFDILLRLPVPDVENYCRINHHAYTICQNPYFWANKLNQDFQIGDGEVFAPSTYVTLYGSNMDRNTYKRWEKRIVYSIKTF